MPRPDDVEPEDVNPDDMEPCACPKCAAIDAAARSKCTEFVGVKFPFELDCMMQSLADMRTAADRRLDPQAPEVTKSEVIRECCEFRASLILSIQLGFYKLYALTHGEQSQPGLTIAGKV